MNRLLYRYYSDFNLYKDVYRDYILNFDITWFPASNTFNITLMSSSHFYIIR